VKENIKGVLTSFGRQKEENDKLKKFINMIIKEHQQLCAQEGEEDNGESQG
jgi:hypothetical protein